jgi:uncharacterized protein YkwD
MQRQMQRLGFKFVVLTALAATLALAPGASARNDKTTGVQRIATLESQVLVQINGVRAAHGLSPLRLSTRLSAAANQHSTQMAVRGYFSHDSADGSSMGRRVGRYYSATGRRYWAVGENLLWSSPSIGPAAALDLGMKSPGHRANLLSREWNEIGLSAVHADSAPGVYGGSPVTIVTTDFGVRR